MLSSVFLPSVKDVQQISSCETSELKRSKKSIPKTVKISRKRWKYPENQNV